MGVDKIIKLVGVIVAVVAGVMGGFPYSGLLIVLLGIGGAWFIAEDERQRLLVATLVLFALGMVDGGTFSAIPVVGGWIDGALSGLSGLFNAAAGTAIVLGLVERLKP
jgi:hypothetical protein